MHLQELKYAAMSLAVGSGGQMMGLEHKWLTLQGVTPGHINSRWRKLFGYPDLTWNGAAHAWLTDQGIPPGPLPSRWYQFWSPAPTP